MSSSPTVEATGTNGDPLVDRAEGFIDRQLSRAAAQVRLFDLVGGLLVWSTSVLAILLALAVVDAWILPLGPTARWLALIGLVGGSFAYLVLRVGPPLVRRINPMFAAKMVEESRPELKNGLMNLLTLRQSPDLVRKRVLGELATRTAGELSSIPVDSAIDRGHVIRIGSLFVALLAFAGLYKILSPKDPFTTIGRIVAPAADVAPPSRVRIVQVLPGDASVRFGQTLEIEVEVEGLGRQSTAVLKYSTDDAQAIDEPLVLAWSEERGRFVGTLATGSSGIERSLDYRIEAGDARSPSYRVDVSVRPTTSIERIELQPPAYTALPPRTLTDRGDIEGLEGTEVTIVAKANVPITSAVLELLAPASRETAAIDRDRAPAKRIPMTLVEQQGTVRFRLELQEDRKTPKFDTYRIQLLTEDGQVDVDPIHYRIAVWPDLAPQIRWLAPRQTPVSVPADGRLAIETEAFDADFRIARVELQGESRGRRVVIQGLLDASRTPDDKHLGKYRFEPAGTGLKPGDEVVFIAIAEDDRRHPLTGQPDPNVARTEPLVVRLEAARENRGADDGGRESGANGDPGANGAAGGDDSGAAGERSPDGGNESPPNDSGESGQEGSQEGESSGSGGGGSSSQQESSEGEGEQQPMSGGSGAGTSGSSGSSEQPPQQGGNSSSSPDDGSENSSGNQSGAPSGSDGMPSGSDAPSPSDDGTSGGASESGENGESPPGAGTGQSGANRDPSTGESPAGETDGSDSGAEGAPENQDGQSGGERSAPRHEGEAFERILERLEREKNGGAQSGDNNQQPGGAQSGDRNQQPGGAQSGDMNQQPGGAQSGDMNQQPGGAQSGDMNQQPGGAQSGDMNQQPGGAQSGDRNQQPGGAQSGDRNQQPGGAQSGDMNQQPGGAQSGDRNQQPGGAQSGDMNQQPGGAQSGDMNQQPGGAQSEDMNQQPSGAQSGDNNQQPGGAQSEDMNQQPGGAQSGDMNQQPGGAQSGDMNQQPGGAQSGDMNQQPGGAQSGDSNQQPGGAQSGDNNQQPGGAQSGDNNQQPGGAPSGDMNQQPGGAPSGDMNQQPSGAPSGDMNQQPSGAPSGTDSGASGETGSSGDRDSRRPVDPRGADPNRSSPSGSAPGGRSGDSTTNDASRGSAEENLPPGEAANLDYARRATDLVLDYLKDQKERPDPKLLDELGWTEEQLREFAERWEAMRSAAREGSPDDRRRLDERLRSLGLMPRVDDASAVRSRQDGIGGLQQDGARSKPPSAYAEKFRQFLRGASQAENRQADEAPR